MDQLPEEEACPPTSTPRILTSHSCSDPLPSSLQKALPDLVRPPFPLRGPLIILLLVPRMLTTATVLPVTTTAAPLGECLVLNILNFSDARSQV